MIREVSAREIIQNVKMKPHAVGAHQYIPDQKKYVTVQLRHVLQLAQHVQEEVVVKVLNRYALEKLRYAREIKRNVLAAQYVKAQKHFVQGKKLSVEVQDLSVQVVRFVSVLNQFVLEMKHTALEKIPHVPMARIVILKIHH